MKISVKDAVKTLIIIILIIPIFFRINIGFIIRFKFELIPFLIIFIGIILYIIFGRLIPRYIYDNKTLEIISQHDVVNAFSKRSYLVILFFFPITMIIEELIFRYYLLGSLFGVLDFYFAIFLSAAIFSLYHLHFWFAFKNLKVVLAYMVYSFLLGLLNGYILYFFGLIICVIVHTFLALDVYYQTYKKLNK